MSTQNYLAKSAFDPRPYSSDGGFSIAGMMITMVAGMATALIVGVLAGIVGQFFYMVMLFPLMIGLAVGGAQVAVIGKSKIRNPLVCGATGLLAGMIAVTAMHYVDYWAFRDSMKDNEAEWMMMQQRIFI